MTCINHLEQLDDEAFETLRANVANEVERRKTARYYMTEADKQAIKEYTRLIEDSINQLASMGYKTWYSAEGDTLFITKNTVSLEYAPSDPLPDDEVCLTLTITVHDGQTCDYRFVKIPDSN